MEQTNARLELNQCLISFHDNSAKYGSYFENQKYIFSPEEILWDENHNSFCLRSSNKNIPILPLFFETIVYYENFTPSKYIAELPDNHAIIDRGKIIYDSGPTAILKNIMLSGGMINGYIKGTRSMEDIYFPANAVWIPNVLYLSIEADLITIADLWKFMDEPNANPLIKLPTRIKSVRKIFKSKLDILKSKYQDRIREISIDCKETEYGISIIKCGGHEIKIYLVLCMYLLDRSPLMPQYFKSSILVMDDFDFEFVSKFLEFSYIDVHIPSLLELKIDGYDYFEIILEMEKLADFLGYTIYKDFFTEIINSDFWPKDLLEVK